MTQQEIDELESVLNAYIADPSPTLAKWLLPIIQQMTAGFKAPALLYRDWMFFPGDKLIAFPLATSRCSSGCEQMTRREGFHAMRFKQLLSVLLA
jgi:hypothetical protein